ncbi:MAG: dockerin type I domain-containing protein [Phycisphaerales bacterium]|nr:dockerin type I domain-containing protein [Phycisphaerales bacterium]
MTTGLLVLVASSPGLAATITVGPPGEADHVYIQDAVDQAQPGDEIVVYPGTYTVSDSDQQQVVDLLGKAITLRSCEGPEATIIDGQSMVRGIVCAGETATGTLVEGFSIINGIGISSDIDGNGQCEPWETSGGGLIIYQSGPTIQDCWFIDNTAGMFGGGVYAQKSWPTFQKCVFQGNTSEYKGGAMFNRGSETNINDCMFQDNHAAYTGGAIHNRHSEIMVTGSMFQGNSANITGGAIYSQWNSNAVISDSIFCGNTGNDGDIDHVHGPWDDNGDNCFSDSCEDSDGNGYPDGCDPCAADATDTDGDGLCDAIDPCPEYPGACSSLLGGGNVIHVAVGESIQTAISLAQDGDTILLEHGVFYEAIDLLGKAITVRSGPSCVPGEGATIDATGLMSSVVTCNTGEGRETRLIGLTITGGAASNGGGVLCWFTSPTIEDCRVIGNLAFDDGGGILVGSGHAAIRRCTFSNNRSLEEGGGLFIEYSDAFVEDCHFENNQANMLGGGLCAAHDGVLTITGCHFQGNNADSSGGGIATINCTPIITNCAFHENTSYYLGGGYYNNGGLSSVSDCEFESNTSIEGAGLGSEVAVTEVSNSVFCDNRDPDGELRNIYGVWEDFGGNVFNDTCSSPGCPTDINNDGVTDVNDILIIIDQYGPCPDDAPCPADVNQNGAVDCPDILMVIDAWGPCDA